MEYRTRQPENLSASRRLGRWLRLKQYQIEVTFGVYMFTPVEKFIFCTFPFTPLFLLPPPPPFPPTQAVLTKRIQSTGSVVFLLFGLFLIACILYLPQHIVFIANRAWFYASGGDMAYSSSSSSSSVPNAAAAAINNNKDALSLTLADAAQKTVESAAREL